MDNGLKVRQILFESLLKEGDNKKNWEKLCCSARPLVPFIGAGISAWCYSTWNDLLRDIVGKVYSSQCAEIVQKALACKTIPKVKNQNTFRWMEEIAECIFETHAKSYDEYIDKYKHKCEPSDLAGADLILYNLRFYVGDEAKNKKVDAVKELYEAFSEEKLKEKGKIPEYQNLFSRLFEDVLVTTNYDKALESCYSSILSYSYMDLNREKGRNGNIEESFTESLPHTENQLTTEIQTNTSNWLFRAIICKLEQRQRELDRKENLRLNVIIPRMPMLLKVHGSIERANDIALSWSGYEKAYEGEMPSLFREIVNKSAMIFLGCGMRDDRILAELNEVADSELFAFLPKMEGEENEKRKELLKQYDIHPIYYDKELLNEKTLKNFQNEESYHDFFLGLLLENLARRKKFYPKALEELWDEDRFDTNNISESDTGEKGVLEQEIIKKQENKIWGLREASRYRWLRDGSPQFVHREQAFQIWNLLNTSVECPLIAIIGEVGTGKTILCKSIQELHKSYKDTMQFFYISMSGCGSWEEFCLRLYEGLNIMLIDMPEKQNWRTLAKSVSERCGVYWRSVLILDHLEEAQASDSGLWDTIINILQYWKENHIRVIFVCQSYPANILCHTWQIKYLQKDEAWRVFLSACQSTRNRQISCQEREVVSALFDRQVFQAAEVNLLGKYANSKSNLSSLLEEWNLYYRPGDKVGQTLARILWNNLLAEHCYDDVPKEEDRINIKKNILWIWGILGKYPGNFPHQFFEISMTQEHQYKAKELSEKTLMYMKNYGLCEEITDEQQNNILKNIINCVEQNFVNTVENNLKETFRKSKKKIDSHGKGMVSFRGYFMHSYEKKLRSYIIEELSVDETEIGSVMKILDVLCDIGHKVENSSERIKNTELDVVLHYEIKTIVRLLHACLMDKSINKEMEMKVVEVSLMFYSYYHYIPDYAHPFIKRILKLMEKREDDILLDVFKKNTFRMNISKANMYKVMGDIKRLLGKKNDAMQCYKKALELCDKMLLLKFRDNKENKKEYLAVLHVKAGILLADNYYRNSNELSEEAKIIYEESEDNLGLAYYNQRAAEMKLAKYGKIKSERKDKEEAKKDFREIGKHFLAALKLYRGMGDKEKDNTKIAYILKSIGDLIVEFKEDIWIDGEKVVYNISKAELNMESDGTIAKREEDKKEEATEDKEIKEDEKDIKTEWFNAAAHFYLEAFSDYCHHINWRGLSNVLQAMGTCIRHNGSESTKIENIYNLAEECYRWMGDIRGLADTLDYFGYHYLEKQQVETSGKYNDDAKFEISPENVMYKYMALSKWRESKDLWEKQEKSDELERRETEIKKLEKNIKKFEKKTSEKESEIPSDKTSQEGY